MATPKRQEEPRRKRNEVTSKSDAVTQFLKKEGYTIGRTIGEGSYCKVKEAEHHKQKMAVKVISKETASTDFLEKFLPREMSVLQEVEHKNIIKIYNVFNFPSHVYIFMELAEKGDLLDYIRERGRLSEVEARCYFRQLVAAISYLHSRQITHRDLKCENILMGPNETVKLIDFGFCRYCVDEVTRRRILSRTFCGSTAYAAPEVLMGHPYNPMMYDLWSLGCILFIMVTGSMPFDDTNVKEMVRHQMKRRLRFPGMTNVLSQDVKNLIRHLLEPDLTKRATLDHVMRSSWFQITDNDDPTKSTTQKE